MQIKMHAIDRAVLKWYYHILFEIWKIIYSNVLGGGGLSFYYIKIMFSTLKELALRQIHF